jgi:hypothetical protein
MGKYFSSNTDTSKFELTESVDKITVPSVDNLTTPLSSQVKEKLSQTRIDTPTTQDDYIDAVKVQVDQVSDMVKKYSDESKKELKNQFEKFAPVELFEKINQLIFVIADMSNRISTLEQIIATNFNIQNQAQPKMVEITDPADLYRLQTRMDKLGEDELSSTVTPQNIPSQPKNSNNVMPDVNDVRRQLNNIKQGKSKSIPSEGFTDKGIKLEEVFPDLDDEAYSAAYTVMNKLKPTDNVVEETPQPGSMRGITGF